jgi:hypothetical protein
MSVARHTPALSKRGGGNLDDGVFLATSAVGAMVVGGMIRKRKQQTFQVVEEIVLVALIGQLYSKMRRDRANRQAALP